MNQELIRLYKVIRNANVIPANKAIKTARIWLNTYGSRTFVIVNN